MTEVHSRKAAIGILLAAGALAYGNSFAVPFHLDDLGSIVSNPTITDLSRIGEVLSPPRESGVTVNGRPLLNLSLAINHAISGLNVWSYHLVNVGIHVAAAVLLFGIVRRTVEGARREGTERGDTRPAPTGQSAQATWVALCAALVWMLHPLQTESVTYIIQRAESLVSLFVLLTLYLFVRGAGEGTKRSARFATPGNQAITDPVSRFPFLPFSVAAAAAGMASKEVMVGAPLIVLLYDRTFVAGSFRQALRLRGGYYAGLAATWVILGWLVLQASGRGGTAGTGDPVSWWHYALTQCRAIVLYLRLMAWPSPLVFDYGIGVEREFGAVALQAVVLAGLVAATVFALRRRPVAGFFGAVFFILLAPSSSVVPVLTQTMAEHRVYLALAAATVPLVVLLHRRLGARGLWAAAAVAAVLGVATIRRNQDYRSGLALWGDTAEKHPSSARAQYNYGVFLLEAGRTGEALDRFRQAIRIRPEYLSARTSLGQALRQSGDELGALEQFIEVVRIHPGFAEHLALARMLERAGRRGEAVEQLRKAVALDPKSVEARNSLGNALLREDRTAEAVAEYRAAIAANPNDPVAYGNLGNALAFSGQLAEGTAALEKALALNPAQAGARLGLALIRVRENPNDPVAQDNYANALTQAGQPEQAAAARQRAAELRARN